MRKKIFATLAILGILALAGGDLEAGKSAYLPATTVNLTVVDTPWTEILRIPAAPTAWGGQDPAEVIMLRISASSVAGGTVAKIRVTPAWTVTDTSLDGDPLRLAYPDVAADSAEANFSTGAREIIISLRWGTTALGAINTFHALPPYLAVELEENRTAGTISVETYYIGD
jgi:hypothetical protein